MVQIYLASSRIPYIRNSERLSCCAQSNLLWIEKLMFIFCLNIIGAQPTQFESVYFVSELIFSNPPTLCRIQKNSNLK